MATTSISIGYRPPKIARLVRAGDLDGVIAAMVKNTHLWGGIWNPIVLVADDDDADDIAATLGWWQADLVVAEGKPSEGMDRMLGRMGHLRPPRLASRGEHPYVDIRLICRHHFENSFRFGGIESQAAAMSWSDEQDASVDPYFTATFGRYAGGPEGAAFRAHYARGLRAREVPLEEADTTIGAMTPIALTGVELTTLTRSRDHGVVVGAPTDPEALVGYWNQRAEGSSVVFWPLDAPSVVMRHARERLTSSLARRSDHGAEQHPFVRVWSPSGALATETPLPEELDELLSERNISPLITAAGVPSRTRHARPAPTWATTGSAVLGSVEERGGQTKLVAALPPHPFHAAKVRPIDRPMWLVTVSTFREADLGDHTLALPRVPELAPWASEAMLVVGDVRLDSEGVSVFEHLNATSVELRLVSQSDVIGAVLKHAGIRSSPSPAGEATTRIVKQMGGLWGCRPLRLHGLRRLVSSGARQWTWAEAMAELHGRGLYKRYRNVRPPADQLRSLIERGVLQPVLSLTCPSCRVTSPFRLDEIEARMSCMRCDSSFNPAPLLESSTWKYRPSGFFLTMSTHGSLPVILTMLRVSDAELLDSGVTVGASRHLNAETWSAEVDCVALWRTRTGAPAMAIGECKGGERPIERSDVDDLVRVAETVRAAGIECYILLATTRPEFTEPELRLFSEVAEAAASLPALDADAPYETRAGLVLLAAGQLDHHEHAPLSKRDNLPDRTFRVMHDLAVDTQLIHLGDQPVDVEPGDHDWLI